MRSVSQPVSGTEIAFATANDVMTQVPWSDDTPRSPEIVGIATLAIDVSSTFMNTASDTAIVPSISCPPASGGRGRVAVPCWGRARDAYIRFDARPTSFAAGVGALAPPAAPPPAFCAMMRAISASASSPYFANTSVS